MLITKAQPQTQRALKANTTRVRLSEQSSSSPAQDTYKKTITGAAYAAGGALGGMALGALGGQVMTHMTGKEVFSNFGGGVGAGVGSVTSLALSLSDEPVSVGRTFGAWAGATAGATAGTFVMGGLGKMLAAGGASPYLGSQGALLGAIGLGLAGAGVGFLGDESKVGRATKAAAAAGGGALFGLAMGGFMQATLSSPATAALLASAPVAGAATLGMLGLQSQINPNWEYSKPNSEAIDVATKSTFGMAGGHMVGTLLGAAAHAFGGSSAYVAAPLVGAALGASAAFGSVTDRTQLKELSVAALSGGAAATVGDAVGHGLSALTGNSIYKFVGPAAGAIAGGAVALERQGWDTKFVLPTALGFSLGTATGALVGAGLKALTGHDLYQVAAPLVGMAAGVCGTLAAAAHMQGKTNLEALI
jgi:hypothetical protein